MGVGNADQSWYRVSKRRMDRKSQSLGPRLKFQLSHVLLQSNVGAQVLLSQAVGGYDPWSSGSAYGLVTWRWDLALASGLVHGLVSCANWLGDQKGDP